MKPEKNLENRRTELQAYHVQAVYAFTFERAMHYTDLSGQDYRDIANAVAYEACEKMNEKMFVDQDWEQELRIKIHDAVTQHRRNLRDAVSSRLDDRKPSKKRSQ